MLSALLILGSVACSSTGTAANKTSAASGKAQEYTCELAVVGAGGGGMMSAMQAARAGASVIVLEKGGSWKVSNTSFAGGTTAVDTPTQKAAGKTVTVDEVFDHMMTYSQGTVNQVLVRRCLEASGSVMKTWMDLGVKMFLGPDRYQVGFETVHVYTTPNKMELLEKDIIAHGGRFLYSTAGTGLIMKDGAVTGVRARTSDGQNVVIHCKAVVISTGGFLNNKEMMDQYFGKAEHVAVAGSPLCTGDGIKMALEAGAIMDTNFALSTYADVAGYNGKNVGVHGTYLTEKRNQAFVFGNIGTMLVDNQGDRFINEYLLANNPLAFGGAMQARIGYYYAIVDQKTIDELSEESPYSRLGRPASWNVGPILFDNPQKNIKKDIETAITEGWTWKADSIEALSKAAGLEHLSKQVARYNRLCEAGVDTDLGVPKLFLSSLAKGPFYAIEYQCAGLVTMGGIKTDSTCCALDKENERIPGLYVAGSDNGSVYSGPYYDVGGTSSGLAIQTGWIAGQEAATFLGKGE